MIMKLVCCHARMLSGMTERWKVDHNASMTVLDLEGLIISFRNLSDMINWAWGKTFELLLAEEILDIDEVGKVVAEALEAAYFAFEKMKKLIDNAASQGYQVSGIQEFETEKLVVEDLRRRFENEWPSINYDMLKESETSHVRGEYEAIENILNGLQSSH